MHCSSRVNALQICSTTKLDIRKCKNVAGVDCEGISGHHFSEILKDTISYHTGLSSALYLCFLQLLVSLEIYAMNGLSNPMDALVATIRGIAVTATQSALNPADAAQIFLQQ